MRYNKLCVFVIYTLIFRNCLCVRCYTCQPESKRYLSRAPLCEHFNGSSVFYTECEYSTVCFKKITSSEFGDRTTVAVERGCALQLLHGDQVRTDKGWRPIKKIYDVYEESCKEKIFDDGRVVSTIDCYCKGDLCNGAQHTCSTFSCTLNGIVFIYFTFYYSK